MFHVKQNQWRLTMAKRKTVAQLDSDIEKLKRRVEIAKLQKELKKSGGK